MASWGPGALLNQSLSCEGSGEKSLVIWGNTGGPRAASPTETLQKKQGRWLGEFSEEGHGPSPEGSWDIGRVATSCMSATGTHFCFTVA